MQKTFTGSNQKRKNIKQPDKEKSTQIHTPNQEDFHNWCFLGNGKSVLSIRVSQCISSTLQTGPCPGVFGHHKMNSIVLCVHFDLFYGGNFCLIVFLYFCFDFNFIFYFVIVLFLDIEMGRTWSCVG